MPTATVVPVSEYLSQMYHPDCDFVEGIIEERHVGELSHGDAQTSLAAFVRYRIRGFWSVVEVRVQVKLERFRVPDVTIIRGGKPTGRIISTPPEVAVEILSPEDRASNIQERIDDYLAFGVPCVWVINPEMRAPGSTRTTDRAKPRTASSAIPPATWRSPSPRSSTSEPCSTNQSSSGRPMTGRL